MKVQNYRSIDKTLSIYLILHYFLLIVAWPRIRHNTFHLFAFLGIGVFVFLINLLYSNSAPTVLKIIRDWYPFPLFIYFFEATTSFNRIIFPDFIDSFFQQIDAAIFGYQPALVWGKVLDNYFWQELFHFAYFSYYLIPILFIVIYLNNKKLFEKFAFVVAFVFFMCYLTYILLPVIGGRWWEIKENYPMFTTQYRYGIFTRIMAFIYRATVHQGGAFPSSHVAIAIVCNLIAFDFRKWLGWILFPITILLTIATVHCHYHYFIDTIFGVFYGIAFYFLGCKIYHKYHKDN